MLSLLLALTLLQSPSGLRTDLLPSAEGATIHSQRPRLSWQLPEGTRAQTAYQVLVATSPDLLSEAKADVWNSGEVRSDRQTGIAIGGDGLAPSTTYYWTVRFRDQRGRRSRYAAPQEIHTSRALDDAFPRLPLCKTTEEPTRLRHLADTLSVADFGRTAFAQLRLTIDSDAPDTVAVRIGEAEKDGRVDTDPGASIRYTHYEIPIHKGLGTYDIAFRPDPRNAVRKPAGTDVRPVLMPEEVGEVYPFRYVEVETHGARLASVTRLAVHYAWDDAASYFHSSDSVLNQVWELCRYSIRATSFLGIYVDGDRERIPYEADALINQLSHYCTDEEFSMARYSVDYLCHNATWPTEWILQGVLLAWQDYLYTGDDRLIQHNYDTLRARTLLSLQDTTGLISTRRGGQTRELLRRCGYFGHEIRDIVDWPQSGALGIGKQEPGEADGYVLEDYNTVVNAFHYEALRLMALIAEALGKTSDHELFSQKADMVRQAVWNKLYDKEAGCFRDGLTTSHHSLHASMFPLAFGMVPEEEVGRVLRHIQSRGMACSVYGAQFLLQALYRGGLSDYALRLLTSTDLRSWHHMISAGATITWEAWDRKFKPNLDWNHAWGAAPANIIPRYVMGVRPLEPGFRRILIQPQPADLEEAEAQVPTILGPVRVRFTQTDSRFDLDIHIPPGATADVVLPYNIGARDKEQGEFFRDKGQGTRSKRTQNCLKQPLQSSCSLPLAPCPSTQTPVYHVTSGDHKFSLKKSGTE